VLLDIDEVSLWWGSIVGCAAYWLMGEYEQAEKLFPVANTLPEALSALEDPLPQATLHGFKARRMFLSRDPSPTIVLKLCDVSGKHLKSSLNFTSCKQMSLMERIAQLFVCDSLLATRTSLWESSLGSDGSVGVDNATVKMASPDVLYGFRNDLCCLREISQYIPNALPRVFLHEATLRMMAGASPAPTQQLLDRTLRYRSNKYSLICGDKDKPGGVSGGSREHATALIMACRHLPSALLSSPGERQGMLSEAAKTLERIGDRKLLQDCYALMRHIGGTSVTAE
jgi:sterol regulatory element-binding transcription factor 1